VLALPGFASFLSQCLPGPPEILLAEALLGDSRLLLGHLRENAQKFRKALEDMFLLEKKAKQAARCYSSSPSMSVSLVSWR
jgi:hypothetical protein